MVGELPAWMRLWCVMRQNTLRCWQYPEDVGRKMPTHSFSFTEVYYVMMIVAICNSGPCTLMCPDYLSHTTLITFM